MASLHSQQKALRYASRKAWKSSPIDIGYGGSKHAYVYYVVI